MADEDASLFRAGSERHVESRLAQQLERHPLVHLVVLGKGEASSADLRLDLLRVEDRLQAFSRARTLMTPAGYTGNVVVVAMGTDDGLDILDPAAEFRLATLEIFMSLAASAVHQDGLFAQYNKNNCCH